MNSDITAMSEGKSVYESPVGKISSRRQNFSEYLYLKSYW